MSASTLIKMPAFLLAFFVVLFATITFVTTVNAQSTPSAEPQLPRWLVNCNNRADPKLLNCAMTQSILQSKSRQRIMTANIFKDTSGALMMRLQLPHGLDLTRGVNIAIDDGQAIQHPIHTADAKGAYVRIPLGDAMLAAMKAGNLFTVGVTGTNRNAISLQLSLTGFSDAVGLMVK